MPAFYSRSSGLPVDASANSPAEVVQLFLAQQALDIERALLVTVPVPTEFEVPATELELSLKSALQEAARTGVVGRDVTPFLLSRMAQSSRGSTLKANLALLENNAKVASQIALALVNVS
jgi:pseudouridine-5'-phosphate glycosidase